MSAWAWARTGSPDSEPLVAEVRVAIKEQLLGRGLRQVTRKEAEFLIDHELSVRTEVRTRDPFFGLDPVEQYEIGTLTIQVLEPSTNAPIWTGKASGDLRLSGVPVSPFQMRFAPTENPRNWKIEKRVEKILAEFPLSQP